MSTKTNNPKVPLIYAYLYMKIKKQMRGDRITGSDLRRIIQKIILCNKNEKTSNKGIPRRYSYDIIKDLVNLNLLERIYKNKSNLAYKETNENISEVIERLKEWKIKKELREDKEVKEKLKPLLDILDRDPLYRVVKSQCDRQLKESFW